LNIENIVGEDKEPNTAQLNPNLETSIQERNSLTGMLEHGQTHGSGDPKNANQSFDNRSTLYK